MNGTKKAFRLVVKREIRRQGELFEKEGQYFYHAVASNWLEEEKNTEEVLKWHNQRGQAENFNKELKKKYKELLERSAQRSHGLLLAR
jgi:dsDNA-specific endonuclease/ATPase MutS2